MKVLDLKMLIWALVFNIGSFISAMQDKSYWYKESADDLKSALNKQRNVNTNIARNLVLAIGDGMGITTTTGARIFKGQNPKGTFGEGYKLSWDEFPYTGLSKTYSTDMTTPDSAATATAFLCGVKTKSETLGVDDNVEVNVCKTVENSKVTSLLDWALKEGKSVGIVTTDEITGATPSAAYAHAAYRIWRHDGELPPDAKGVCKDIARQLIEDNMDINVILGGGRKSFLPKKTADPEHPAINGSRTDDLNLIQTWEDEQRKRGRKAQFVYTKSQFDAINVYNTDYLLGLFSPTRMEEETFRRINQTEPSISELVEKALGILMKNPKGFFLLLEGANIDMGHHENRARFALEEASALDEAVRTVIRKTSADDTLVVVTADHSHVFSLGGYSQRNQSLVSLAKAKNKLVPDGDGNAYAVISYGNGPGYRKAQRANLTEEMFEKDQVYLSNTPLDYETHGAEDVPIFASGPYAHFFSGVHEQTYIAHAMAYAGCIGDSRDHCTGKSSTVKYLLSPLALLIGQLTIFLL